MIDQYRKKPIVVEAVQFTGTPSGALELWLGEAFETWLPSSRQLIFRVAKGRSEALLDAGDWIIAEPDGTGFYPCTAEDFEATYEPVGASHE